MVQDNEMGTFMFLSKSPETQTTKLKRDKPDFIRLKCAFAFRFQVL